MESGPKENRAIDSSGLRRNDPILGTQGRVGRSPEQVGRSAGRSLSQPDYARSSPECDSPDAEGATDHIGHVGPSASRPASTSDRYVDSTFQSLRDSFVGKQLADCPPLGTDPTGSSIPSKGRRKGDGHEAGAGKAQGFAAKGGKRKGKIGKWQRTRPGPGEVRESLEKSGAPAASQPSAGESGEGRTASDLQREGDPIPSSRGSREKGSPEAERETPAGGARPEGKTPEGQEGQTAKGEKWKQQAKLKGKGKGKQSESGSAAEARRVEMR